MNFDRNFPVPSGLSQRVAEFRKMEIGDSFLKAADEATNWRIAMSKAHADGQFYFISRTTPEGIRFWRKG